MNYELKTLNGRRRCLGYTLIELLVVLGILALTVGGILMFLTSTLRGSNKTSVNAEVKQNGQAILDSLERQMRGASSAEEIGTNHDYIKLVRDGKLPLYIRCQAQTASHTSRIVSQEASSPPSSFISISNDDPTSGVSVDNCKFFVFPAGSSPDGKPIPAVVSISFDISKAGDRVDLSSKSTFQTTISLRNY